VRIELVDLEAVDRHMGAALRAAVDRVASSGRFILGEPVASFETALAKYCGVRHAVGVASGSDALVLALRAVGVRAGEVVVTTPLSFIATSEAIMRVGAVPCFLDVDESLCLSPAALSEYISGCRSARDGLRDPDTGTRVSTVLPVHLYGRACAQELETIASSAGLSVLYDAAQSIGPAQRQPACLSFHPTKNLGAWGDGGAVLCNDDAFAEHVRSLRVHGLDSAGRYAKVGMNSRLDALQAVVLETKLALLDEMQSRRANNARFLREALIDVPGLVPPPSPSEGDVCHLFTVRCEHRDELQQRLDAEGIGSRVYYRRLLSSEPAVTPALRGGPLDQANKAANEVLSLPVHPFLTEDDLARIAATVRSAM
jgi:dTDP-4-amino-4,6-dideoxygalactose transaminase